MDVRIEKIKHVAQQGNIDDFYNLIQEDAKLLEHIDELPFVDTPLHIAASFGNIPIAMEMMGLKPSFARKLNPYGFSPIHLALQNGHTEMVHHLLQFDGDLVRVKAKEHITPLHYVAKTDYHLDLLPKFLSICLDSITDVTIRNETALHIAMKNNVLDAFKLLVGWLGSDWSQMASIYGKEILDRKDEKGDTVLHIAVSKNQTEASSLHSSIMKIQINIYLMLNKI
jgi:ankyrin repeat protein